MHNIVSRSRYGNYVLGKSRIYGRTSGGGYFCHSPFEYDSLNIIYLFVGLNALSILLFKLIEEPLNHYIRKSNFLVKAK